MSYLREPDMTGRLCLPPLQCLEQYDAAIKVEATSNMSHGATREKRSNIWSARLKSSNFSLVSNCTSPNRSGSTPNMYVI